MIGLSKIIQLGKTILSKLYKANQDQALTFGPVKPELKLYDNKDLATLSVLSLQHSSSGPNLVDNFVTIQLELELELELEALTRELQTDFPNLQKNLKEGKVHLQLQNIVQPSEIIITISDFGTGIEPKYFETQRNGLIDLFTLHQKEERVPVGMAEVYCIVGISGGRLKVESLENKGTKFTVWLPTKF